MRAHEHAFTFGSSTSTFFQRHKVNCTGLGEEKVKAAVATERCKSADGPPTAVKTAVCTVNLAIAYNALRSLCTFALFFFFFHDQEYLLLVLDCSWSLASTYIRYSMTCRTYFAFIILLLRRDTCCFVALFFALLKLPSRDVVSALATFKRTYFKYSWSVVLFHHCCHLTTWFSE